MSGLTEILPSALARLGLPGCVDTLGLAERVGDARRLAVLLVDGLGYHLLPRAAESSPLFAAVLSGSLGRLDELACTLPSTTPTSLVSLGTGTSPGAHGVLGFTLNVPGTDRVLTHIFWRDDPDPAVWQPVPTLFERAAAAGLPSSVVLPAMFEGSGLTVAAYRGAGFIGLAPREDAVAGMLAGLAGGAGLVYGYTSRVDTAAHVHGISSPEWARAAAEVGAVIERLLAGLPDDAALLVTADHGGLDVPAKARLDLADDPRLTAGLRLVAGEPRFRHLHTVPGAADDVVAAWRAVLGERAEIYCRDEAIAAGWFGPVTEAHRPRIGDVVALARGDTAVLASGYEPPEVAKLVGFHGAATPAETAIPLLTLLPGRVG
jgi:hypothetical protein